MIAWLPNVSLPVDTRLDVTLCASSFSPRCLGREHRHRSGMAVCLRLAIWSLVIVLAAGENPSSPPPVSCWAAGWRDPGDSSGTNQCPPMTVARGGDDDQHDCEEACDQSECCQKTCWSSGWRDSGDSSGTNQCPVTSNVRRGSDDECGSGGQSGECDQYGCCEPTCGKSGFVDQSSCPSGTELRYESSSSKGASRACSSSLARSSGMCQQADCCRQTCSDAGYKTGGTRSCPTGMAYRTDHHGVVCLVVGGMIYLKKKKNVVHAK